VDRLDQVTTQYNTLAVVSQNTTLVISKTFAVKNFSSALLFLDSTIDKKNFADENFCRSMRSYSEQHLKCAFHIRGTMQLYQSYAQK